MIKSNQGAERQTDIAMSKDSDTQ